MKSFLLPSLLLTAILLSACSKNLNVDPINTPPVSDFKISSLVDADNAFAIDLIKKLQQSEDPESNFFISPASISIALGMLFNGAEGDTRKAMESTLYFSGFSPQQVNERYRNVIDLLNNADPKALFKVANSIWYRDGFQVNTDFLNTNDKYFDSEVKALNFDSPLAKTEINDWVKAKTNNKITKIVDQINAEDVLFLINAIYFKGDWKFEFDEAKTTPQPFHLLSGNTKSVAMMITEEQFKYYEDDEVQLIDLLYNQGRFSMTIVLPKPSFSMDHLLTNLSNSKWNAWVKGMTNNKVVLQLPKLKMDYEKSLKETLSEMGMGIAFTAAADFSKMTPADVLVSRIKHKTFVDINEKGTEAAAVTSIGISVTSVGGPPKSIQMTVDRPYLVFITEKESGTIVFSGKIMEPII